MIPTKFFTKFESKRFTFKNDSKKEIKEKSITTKRVKTKGNSQLKKDAVICESVVVACVLLLKLVLNITIVDKSKSNGDHDLVIAFIFYYEQLDKQKNLYGTRTNLTRILYMLRFSQNCCCQIRPTNLMGGLDIMYNLSFVLSKTKAIYLLGLLLCKEGV